MHRLSNVNIIIPQPADPGQRRSVRRLTALTRRRLSALLTNVLSMLREPRRSPAGSEFVFARSHIAWDAARLDDRWSLTSGGRPVEIQHFENFGSKGLLALAHVSSHGQS